MNAGQKTDLKLDETNEYIDIIDVLGFLWRSKIYLLVGLAIGILSGLIVTTTKKPPVFVVTLPTDLEVAGGIKPEQIIGKFNELTSRSDVQSALGSAQVNFVAGKPPFKLKIESGSVNLEVSSFTTDPAGDKAFEAAKALTEAARAVNKKIAEAERSVGASKSGKDQLQSSLAKLMKVQALEESSPRLKLFAIEAKLAQKSGVRPAPAASYKGSAIGDDVLRLLALAEGKMSAQEREAIVADYAVLVGEIRAIQTKYEQPIIDVTSALAEISGNVLNEVTREGIRFPVVVVDEASFKSSVAAGSHEHFESKRALFIILGATLGAMMGLIVFGVVTFFRENSARLRKVIG